MIFSTAFLSSMERIARAAGDMMRAVPDEVRLSPHEKEGSANFVTAYDIKVQDFLKGELSAVLPDARFLAEEDGRSRGSVEHGLTFVIDPIDGTTNFMCGYNTSAVSIGLLSDGEPIFGGVYDPYRDEYFSAMAGQGATCNREPIRVSSRPLGRAIVAIGSAPYHKEQLASTMMKMTAALFDVFADFRRSGSAALDICHVAAGRLDAFCEPILSPWDFTAGTLILREAGGLSAAFDGTPLSFGAPSSCVFGSPVGYAAAARICRPYADDVSSSCR